MQPYNQFSTKEDYLGYSGEAGFGLKQKDGPFSVRVTGRYFQNDGHPQSFLGLAPVSGAPGVAVSGAVVDPKQVESITAGTSLFNVPPGAAAVTNVPGSPNNPIFAAQSPARITQAQGKLKIGYDDGSITAQALFAYWHNVDSQNAPDCYLRDATGKIVCEGRVTIGSQTYTASGATFSRTVRDEYLAGLKVAAPFAENWTARLALSTYKIPKADVFSSSGYATGLSNGAGTVTDQGPTGWYTGDLLIENKTDNNELSLGFMANHYQTDQTRLNVPNWRSKSAGVFSTQTFDKTRTASAFAENRFLIGSDGAITLGVRYDNWRAFDGGLARLGTGVLAGQQVSNHYALRTQDAISPALSGEVCLADGTKLQFSLAMATRFPTVGELFQGGLNGDGTFNINSFDPDLKPERSRDFNALVSHDFGPITLTGSFFYQRVQNTIFSFFGTNQNGVSTSNFKGVDLTRQYGLELIAEARNWPIAGMDIDLNGAYIDAKTFENAANRAAEGVRFPRIPKWRINGNFRYAVSDTINTSLGFRFATRLNTDLFGLQRGDTFGFTSELFALDAKVNWTVTDQLRVSAGVDNLTNNRAWVVPSLSAANLPR